MESFRLEQISAATPENEIEVEKIRAENASLKKQVIHLERILENRDERIKYLEEHAFIDPLTGAFNRRAFDPELEQSLKLIRGEVEEHREGVKPLTEISLIMLDLDHFKKINDTFGHLVGDEVLRKVSALLMDSVRETDMAARYGGEEFMIFLRGADETIAAEHAEKLRAEIGEMEFDIQPDLKITASFGVVSSKSSTDAESLKKFADKALYKAKDGGRNRVEVHTEDEYEPLPTTSE